MKSDKKKMVILIAIVICVALGLTLYFVWHSNNHSAPKDGVSFFTDEGVFIENRPIKGNTVIPPKVEEVKQGKVFIGWDTDITQIKNENNLINTKAEYFNINDAENVIAIPAVYTENDKEFSVPLKILGKVNLCGADITLSYDVNVLEFVGDEKADKDVVMSHDQEPGLIYIRFANSSNATGEIDLLNLKFKSKVKERMTTDIVPVVKEIVKIDDHNNIIKASHNVVDGRIFIY